MSARDEILGRVRTALGRTTGAAVPPPPPVPMLGRVDLDTAQRLRLFTERLEAVAGLCHDGDAAGVVADLIAHHRPRTIAASDAAAVRALCELPVLRSEHWLPADATKEQLFAADLGITTAQWGIAETGTVVLDSATERHRLPSLLPPVHIVLLPKSRVLATLGELLKTVGRPLPPALTLITGPSRTADIELQLVLGVHGPRELHVVLV